MKNLLIIFLFLSSMFVNSAADIIPRWNGGRLGDNFRSLFRAWWLAYKHDHLIFCYAPFNYSEFLVISNMLKLPKSDYKKKILLPTRLRNNITKEDNVLYTTQWETDPHIDWRDKEFLTLVRAGIKPKEYNASVFPQADISVALHIRRGGGFRVDTSGVKRRRPYHFPPVGYYINQLKKVIELYPEKTLYVHIFTDDAKPINLCAVLQREFSDYKNIHFGCRTERNKHNANVLQDFFDMMQFDVLIRPQSHFSIFAERLGFFKLVIGPNMKHNSRRRRRAISHVLLRRYNRQRYLVGPTFV